MNHPMQPVQLDERGVLRFKHNAIVRFLLDNGGHDMNDLAMQDFSDDDSRQFAQLIGYSVCGFCDLSYVDEDTIERAEHEEKRALDNKEKAV